VLGVVGPNGAGKTTTMRALCGIIPPSGGRLSVAGHDIVEDPIGAKSQLAFIPDEPQLFDVLTVWEHLEFTASIYRVANFADEAERLLEKFELTEKRNTIAQELSRGMRQKVAICCGYLHQPKAIIFDEPLSGPRKELPSWSAHTFSI
jgi:ABC-2 type transport system ATP-binding protein